MNARMPARTAYVALTKAQKPARGVSLYSRYINRPSGRVIAAGAAALGLQPNQVTAVSALFAVAGVVLIAVPEPRVLSGIGAALALMLSFAFDSADGQLARLQQSGSPAGEWLDHVLDAGKGVTIHGAVLICTFRYLQVPMWWLLIPLAFQLVAVGTFAAGTLRELIGARAGVTSSAHRLGYAWWSAVLLLPADAGVMGLSFVTLGWHKLFVVVYSGMLLANAVLGGVLMVKWMRELSVTKNGRSSLVQTTPSEL